MVNNHDLAKKTGTEAVHFSQILEAFNQIDESFWLLQGHGIKFTPKIYSLKFHIPEFINEYQRALGLYIKQARESS